jgi:hypothetical protein
MKRLIPLFSFAIILAAVFAFSVNADSTITIPVPDKVAQDKKVTLSLRIPPNTEALTQKPMPKLKSRSSLIVWNNNPTPKVPVNDEVYEIMERFLSKGWIKGLGPRNLAKKRPLDRIYVIRVLEEVVNNVLEVAQAPNIIRKIRTLNLQATDVEDLRRMLAKYNKDFFMFGMNTKKVDQDLLMFQEKIKTAKTGVLKVIKVEGTADGSTIIHLNVD